MIGRQALPKLPSEDLIGHQQAADTLNRVAETALWISPVLNDKIGQMPPPDNLKRDGLLAYADGTNWNPGDGKGYYRWDSGLNAFKKIETVSMWNDDGTYIYPNNVTNSGNTSFRIYDSGYTQIGPAPSYTDSGGVSGGIQLQIKATGSTAKPNVWIERDISANYVSGSLFVTAGLQVQAVKSGGNASVHGIFSEMNYSSGTGDAVAVGGRMISSVARNLFGGLFRATSSTTAKCIGVEANAANSGDSGHSDTIPSSGVVGLVAKVTGSSSSQRGTHGIFITIGDNGEKFHSGLTIGQDSIVPSSGSGIRQGVYIIGGSTSGNRYFGIRMKGQIEYAMEISEATCLYNIAIHFAPAHILTWGIGEDNYLGGALYMGSNGHLYWRNYLNATTYQLTP